MSAKSLTEAINKLIRFGTYEEASAEIEERIRAFTEEKLQELRVSFLEEAEEIKKIREFKIPFDGTEDNMSGHGSATFPLHGLYFQYTYENRWDFRRRWRPKVVDVTETVMTTDT